MRIRNARLYSALACVLGLLLCMISALMTPIYAAAEETGTLTLTCENDGIIMAGMNWDVYHIGSHLATGEFVLEGDFAGYPVSFDDLSASAMQDAANTLENYAKLDGLSPLMSGTTAEDGTLEFAGLEKGLYLISGETTVVGEVICTPAAAIIEIRADENGSYDLSVYPKSVIEIPEPQPSEYSVVKVWSGDEGLNVRPESITADIYANGELYDTVTLDETNGWSYSWEAADNVEWSIVERDVPAGYTVVYRTDGAQFEIVNTYGGVTSSPDSSSNTGTDSAFISSPDSSSGTSSTPSKLPQTGQLWWPVPIFALLGLVLIAIGWRLSAKKDKDK